MSNGGSRLCAIFAFTAFFLVVACASAVLPTVSAEAAVKDTIMGELNDTGMKGGFVARSPQTSLPHQIGILIRGIMGLLGVIFLILVVYAGYKWMLAHGEPGEVKAAQQLLLHSIIGLVITAAAYALTSFVIKAVTATVFTP